MRLLIEITVRKNSNGKYVLQNNNIIMPSIAVLKPGTISSAECEPLSLSPETFGMPTSVQLMIYEMIASAFKNCIDNVISGLSDPLSQEIPAGCNPSGNDSHLSS